MTKSDHAGRPIVVVTGMGIVTSLGAGREDNWRKLTAGELDAYVAGGQWRGKAGAYGIQDENDPFVQRIDGSFSNVVGLPMELLMRMLRQFDALPAQERV